MRLTVTVKTDQHNYVEVECYDIIFCGVESNRNDLIHACKGAVLIYIGNHFKDVPDMIEFEYEEELVDYSLQ